jgi:hypothetical protein
MDDRAKEFARDMERYGKEAGKKAETFAKGFVSDVERFISGRSVCPKCEASWPGVHDYCANCGSPIK